MPKAGGWLCAETWGRWSEAPQKVWSPTKEREEPGAAGGQCRGCCAVGMQVPRW